MTDEVYIYTDGSVTNPRAGKSPGGWAYMFQLNGKLHKKSGAHLDVTNQQMEMMAAIKALEFFYKRNDFDRQLVVVSDSQYLVKGASEWLKGWQRKNYRGIKNTFHWKKIAHLNAKLNVRWQWVRGHTGVPENEYCDMLAGDAAKRALKYRSFLSRV